jgi:hypothetical protein
MSVPCTAHRCIAVLYGTVYRVRKDLLACRGDVLEMYKQLKTLDPGSPAYRLEGEEEKALLW